MQHHLEAWLVAARARERVVPEFVEDALRSFLDWGIPAHGFLRVHCDACRLDRVVPFSCKGRGLCPSRDRREVELDVIRHPFVLPKSRPAVRLTFAVGTLARM